MKWLDLLKNTGKNKVLEEQIHHVRLNVENNYKDAAQEDFRVFEKTLQELKAAGKLTEKQVEYYDALWKQLKEEMKKFSHFEQRATWDQIVG